MSILEFTLTSPVLNFNAGADDDLPGGFSEPGAPAAPFADEDDFISNPGDEDEIPPKKKVNEEGIEEESLEELALKDDAEEDEEENNY